MTLRTRRSLCRALLSFAALFATFTLPVVAATIDVPSTATPTIQSGIDAASNGDTVLVAPGTYFENIDFKGKAIQVVAADAAGGINSGGAADTIIDGGGKGPTVTFASGETASSRLAGFTIQHGGGTSGINIQNGDSQVTAGIVVLNSSPTILGDTITRNNCYGVLIENASPNISASTISNTDGTPSQWCDYVAIGAGILVDGALASNANSPTPIYPTILNNIIENNTDQVIDASSSGGGGIHVLVGQTYIADNTIRNNFSQQPGGGIAVSHYNPSFDPVYIVGNLIYGNSSACGGGGIAFNQNTAFGIDAPVYFIYNNTIADNLDTNNCADRLHPNGSQVYLWQDSNRFVFANNIIAGTSTTQPAFYCETMRQYYPQYHLAIFDHNDLYNPQGAVVSGQCLDPTGDLYGNISADPLFKNRANSDYHLLAGSPAIDTGNNAAVGVLTLDRDGKARQQDATSVGYPIVDMGVYEYSGTTNSEPAPTFATLTQDLYFVGPNEDFRLKALFTSPIGTPSGTVTLLEDGIQLIAGILDASGAENYLIGTDVPGVHTYVANYLGQGAFTPATSIKIFVVVQGGTSTTMTLASSMNPSSLGQSVTFTATVTSATVSPTGTVTFTDGTATLGTQTLVNGVATYTTSALAAGTHHIFATYTPDSTSFLDNTATLSQVVTGNLYESKIIFLPGTPNPSALGQAVTFTIKSASADPSYIPSPIVLAIDNTNNHTVLATLIPDAAGNASITTTTLPVGPDTITATYAGDSTHAAEQLSQLQDVVGAYATTTALASSLNPANVGQSVTFTATVTSSNGTPTGLITFTDGIATLSTATLVKGVATYTTSTLAVGTHPITAAYNPTGTAFNSSNAALSQVINGLPTTTSITVAPTTAVYGTNLVMTATVNFFGSPNYSGGITFMDGTTAISTGELLPGSSTSSLNYTYLTVGTHIITAVYSGDATHSASTSAPVSVTITAASTTLSLAATPNPALAFQQITLTASLTGSAAANTITFLRNGTVIGTAQTNAQGIATLPISLPAGTYTLSAAFPGTTNLATATSAPTTEVVNPVPTTTAIFAQPNPGYQNTTETVTANVLAEFGNSVPAGTVIVSDDNAPIFTGALDATGSVTFSTTAFTVGRHVLTASFKGAPSYIGSDSVPYVLTILPRDFTLTADPSLTIQTEHHKDLNLTLASLGNFTDLIALSCGPMPPDAYCTFSSNGPLLAAGSTLPSTVRIDTDAIYNYLSSRGSATRTPMRSRNVIAFALLLPFTLLAAIRRRRELRRTIRLFASLSIFLIAATFTGCSGHYPGHTPPGNYSITITGQGVSTHITHTATVTLIVTE